MNKLGEFIRARMNWDVGRLFILVIIAVLIRMPKNLRLTGDDAFLLSWYGWAIVKGYATEFLVHPLSFAGAYPFSGYPILTEGILALFLLLTNDIYVSWYLTSGTIAVISVFTCRLLFRTAGFSILKVDLITFFYIINPMFVLYSYGSISSRAIFIAVFPLFLRSVIRIFKDTTVVSLIEGLFSTLLLLTTHRVSMIFIPLFGVALFVFVFTKPFGIKVVADQLMGKISLGLKKLILVFTIVLSMVIGIWSTYIFNLKPENTGIIGIFDFEPGLGSFAELVVDQVLRQGISFYIAGIFVLYILLFVRYDSFLESNEWLYIFLGLFYIALTFFFLPISWYLGIILQVPFSYLAGLGTWKLYEGGKEGMEIVRYFVPILLLLFPAAMIFGIPRYKNIDPAYVVVYTWILGSLVVIVLANFLVSRSRRFSGITYRSLVVLVLIISLFSTSYYVDTLTVANETGFPYPYLTESEMETAEFLVSLNHSGRFISSHFKVGKRLMGLTGLLFYEDQFGGSGVVSGYNNMTNVQKNATLRPVNEWWNRSYIYNPITGESHINNIWWRIFQSEVTSDWILNLFSAEATKYIIFTKDRNVTYGDSFDYSVLLDSMTKYLRSSIVFDSQYLSVYELNMSNIVLTKDLP